MILSSEATATNFKVTNSTTSTIVCLILGLSIVYSNVSDSMFQTYITHFLLSEVIQQFKFSKNQMLF